MFEPIGIVTPEFQNMIEAIRRPHIQGAWSILSQHVGHESAISRKEYVRQLRIAIRKPNYDERQARKLIELIRDADILVLGDRRGYWVGTPTEVLEWAGPYQRHAFTMLRHARRLVKTAKNMTTDLDVRNLADEIDREIQLTLNLKGSE